MRVQALGHVVLKVRNLARAEAFYHGLLGMPVATRWAERGMTFFTLGNHHDFAIAAVGDDAPAAPGLSPGLAHIAFKVGDSLDDLRAVKREMDSAGIPQRPVDHGVSQSLYVSDPDGNVVELYVDTSDAWKTDPSAVAKVAPLDL
ncbi:VOC family protein [Minwuia sp.]|uniref:VOC family protein n=1 Tax=Minwuia sp. TaxID=2493630 RepID=UPI003A9265E1